MRRHRIDAAIISVLALLAAGVVLVSATGGERVSVVLLAVVLAAAAIVIGCMFVGYKRYTHRPVIPAIIAPVMCLLIICSVAMTHWPLRVAYALSRGSFDALARRVRAGEVVATPVHVGFFIIRRAELSRSDIVCLWTDPDPAGSTGFVQCRPDYVPFNLWSQIRLDDHWQFISED
jgi:cytochrome c oxidase subunit IV